MFGAVGTAGQRCTTTRRLIVHEKVLPAVLDKLVAGVQAGVRPHRRPAQGRDAFIGPPDQRTGGRGLPARDRGGQTRGRREVLAGAGASRGQGHFVQPTIIRAPGNNELAIAREETFAPILYVFSYKTIDQAIAMQNGVDQGLSSAVFTESLPRERAVPCRPRGRGATAASPTSTSAPAAREIGGAFGGEKDTGGGRESGATRGRRICRQTCTVNYAGRFELAQGSALSSQQPRVADALADAAVAEIESGMIVGLGTGRVGACAHRGRPARARRT